MLRVAFAGTFPASLEAPVRRHLGIACEIVVADESAIIAQLGDIDVLVTMALTPEMGRAASRLKLVQVPGAGLDRIDRSALPDEVPLANVYGHETGIAEYVIGAMLALTRDFSRLDMALRAGEWRSQWSVGVAPTAHMVRAGGQNARNTWVWAHRSGGRSPRSRLRHEHLGNSPRCWTR